MTRWKCLCSYDGTRFAGWQRQPTKDAIQDTIERSLTKIFKTPILTQGSGRTDAGVHALGQVFHFDADWGHGVEKLIAAIGSSLPDSIQILSAEQVDESFHARHSATGKKYHYRIFRGVADPFQTAYCLSIPYDLDLDAIRLAGSALIGTHDFTAFAAENGDASAMEKTIKTFRSFELIEKGPEVRMVFEASGFMYKMVRSLTGGLLRVGGGRLSPEAFKAILENRQRTKDIVTASPQGLFLEQVFY